MVDEKQLRARILRALNASLIVAGFEVVACGESDSGPLSVSCQNGTAEITCWAPGETHFNIGNVPPEKPVSTPAPIFDANGCQVGSQVADGCCNPAAAGPEFMNGQCCYTFCTGACCGRPLVVDGSPRLAPVERRAAWGGPPFDDDVGKGLSANARATIAAEWLADAQMEHASIASFARFVMDLLAFAAPPDLVLDAQRAGMDEVEHTRSSFAVASAYAGTAYGPGALNLEGVRASRSLAEAAVSAFLEGCVGETTATLLATERSRAVEHVVVRNLLATIATDEARHAELAFRFVAWAIETGTSEVRDAVAETLRRVEQSRLVARECHAHDPILRAHGCLSEREIHQVEARALSEVILPSARVLIERPDVTRAVAASSRPRPAEPH